MAGLVSLYSVTLYRNLSQERPVYNNFLELHIEDSCGFYEYHHILTENFKRLYLAISLLTTVPATPIPHISLEIKNLTIFFAIAYATVKVQTVMYEI